MAQLESSVPLLIARAVHETATSILPNADPFAAGPNEGRKTDMTPRNDRTAWRGRWSPIAHPFIKLAAWITACPKASTHAIRRSWKKSWTAETSSFIFSVLVLAGLVVTLFVHQGKPLPKWPQLITINSVLSLFSLLMRTGVSVVLAEGMSHFSHRLLSDAMYCRSSHIRWGMTRLKCREKDKTDCEVL
jgi:hypothetical protein